jgi:hypothetical protein
MRRSLLAAFFVPLLPLVSLVYAGCDSDPGTSSSAFPNLGSRSGGSNGQDGGASLSDGAVAADATVTPVAVTAACADLAAARCKRDDACTSDQHNVAVYGSESTCESRTSAACVLELAAPSTAQTAATVEACAKSVPGQSCSDFFDEIPTPACAPLAGALTSGAACISSSQCASTYCAVAPGAVCGSCAAVPKAGDPCSGVAECGARGGLTCADGKCIPIGQSGSACTGAIPCGFGLSCVGATSSVPGTCQAAAADAGASCDPTGETAAGCSAGLECDPTSSTCVLTVYAAGGKVCGALDGGAVGCAAGACVIPPYDAGPPVDAAPPVVDAGEDAEAGGDAAVDASPPVDAAPPPAIGRCVAAVIEGTACDTMVGPPCLPPGECVHGADGGSAGTCAVPNGATCK